MEALNRKETIPKAVAAAAALLVGYELVKTMRESHKTGYAYVNKNTGSFFLGLLQDDIKRIAQIAGSIRPGGELVIDSDNMEDAELETVGRMLEGQVTPSQ